MKWSKVKKGLEDLLADTLKGRVQYHCTRYGPGVSYYQTRAWVTLDKTEVASFSTPRWHQEHRDLADRIRQERKCLDFRDPRQRTGYNAAGDQAREILERRGVYSRDDFYRAAESFLQMPIEDAVRSGDAIVRALSMLDRRVGKRRLTGIALTGDEPELVRRFYQIRCQAEGIDVRGKPSTTQDTSEIRPREKED